MKRYGNRPPRWSLAAIAVGEKMAELADLLPAGISILEVGSGRTDPREIVSYMAFDGKFSSYTTLDFDERFQPDLVANITKCPQIPDSSYDVVVCSEVLEHVFDFGVALSELHRVAKKALIITTPFQYPYHAIPEDYWRYSPTALERLLDDWLYVETGFMENFHHSWAVATDDDEIIECLLTKG